MGVGDFFRRVGAAKPLVPGAIYAATAVAAEALIALAPESRPVLAVATILWLVGSAFLFVVVTWFRHDDWLEAGIIVGLSAVLGGALARGVALGITERSIAGVLMTLMASPGTFLALLLSALVFVPLSGGAVALARIVIRPAPRVEPGADTPERPRKFRFG